ncbi:MAG TPA: hypothetical protein VG347_25160 [Verrucomicrobiae bacterium]|nr:hypothetical protein [Verrucomicrobiae bacterium]
MLMLLLLAFPKTMLIPAVGFCLYVVIYHLGPIHDKSDTWSNLVYIWLCIGSFFLSRGLRRGSRGWRTCALMLTWWAMLSTVGGAIWYFFSHDTHKRMDMSPITFFACSIIYFLFSAWQYRVLTRPDVRELFGL